MSRWTRWTLCWGLLLTGNWLNAAEPVTLENVQKPAPNKIDEPLAESYSLEKAVEFLDSASLTWQKERQCFACHTNYSFLYARPHVDANVPAHQSVRAFAEELVEQRWEAKGPRWDAEVIATAAALAFNDAQTTGKLHATTKKALDRMWSVQRADGGWTWLKCNWPPMESDDHYGACLAAVAVAVAPEKYCESPAAQAGISKLKDYLARNPAPTLHHEAMLLWATSLGEPFLTSDQAQATKNKLLALQQPDGGWSLPTLGDWKRQNGSDQSKVSDGYGTGFTMYVLHSAGIPGSDERLQSGIKWLKQNQRESGRWFTRSLTKDSQHFISHAATAFAIMAIKSCDAPQTNIKTTGF